MDILIGMRTYAAVVSAGSFTAAAKRLGISKALVSKYVGQLEEHLDVRLLNRTTRQLNVTEAGQAYYQRCRQILDDLDELEAAVKAQQAVPKGKLIVSAPTTFGEQYLTRAVADYLDEQPDVTVELVLADRFVNIVDEGFDLAIRIGELADSSLIARRLAPIRIVTCASPTYLSSSGSPSHPDELDFHNCIIDTNFSASEQWPFQEDGRQFTVRVKGRFVVNNALAVREMMIAGQGIGHCPDYVVRQDVQQGRLKIILQDFETLVYGVFAIYPHNRHLAAKVRTFVDFLVARFATEPEWDKL